MVQIDLELLPNSESSGPAGSLELQLPDMVRGAWGPELCSVWLVRDGAGPRRNLFRCRCLRGWWPVVKLRVPEAQAGKKKRKKRRKGRPEDLRVLGLRRQRLHPHSGCGQGRNRARQGPGLSRPKNLASVAPFPGEGGG